MESIDNSFYKIQELQDLFRNGVLEEKSPRRLWLRRQAFLDNLNNYYLYAVSSVRFFQEAKEMYEKEIFKPTSQKRKMSEEEGDFDYKLCSSAIAFYGHCRVCIESARLLLEEAIFTSSSDKEVTELQKHRDKYAKWACYIINNRNALTSHPHETRRMITGTSSGHGSNGQVTFNTLDLDHLTLNKKKFILDPTKDLLDLRCYIEETADLLEKIYSKAV